ncbi:RagB/SusD family nutrient uptake outer membrane protein [Maribellus sediminis]|uniref:RagB/SusD family nutrient uptake outer membrane protein n=1 Tax=Maribellus sediminis TaxID=2696285 RepID=UPI0014300AE9|nr:RagB/SusD family nutrient uptake outer membrane protein [Maribellus sediminis]
MKRITTYISGLILVFALSSCNDWLTVYPETEVPHNVLLVDEAGFVDAMTGVYVQMKSTSAYGLNLTMTSLEYLVSSWDVTSQSAESYIGTFDYKNDKVKPVFTGIYSQEYKVIAGINSILGAIDEQKENFVTKGMYEQIKGECLGLRAYIHFDVLRLFGPVPTQAGNENILPYVTVLSKDVNPHITFSEFKILLEKDMEEAENLLAVAEEYGNYAGYESIRMSHQALKALKARAHLWFGETSEAYELATEIIGSTDLELGTSANMSEANYPLTVEHIFGMHEYNLRNRYNNNFGNRTLKKGSSSSQVNIELYGNTGTDIREANLWELSTGDNGAQGYILKKYKVSASATSNAFSSDYRRIPLIRLSEMYLIAAETAPSVAEAKVYWSTFKTSRNLANDDVPEDHTQFVKEIVKEYRREFFGEGQAFYAYKRLNVGKEDFLWLPANTLINYVVPLPDSEISYN